MAADMTRTGVAVADIGTDHAYLPVYLVQSARAPRALACDLREQPLQNARETVRRYGLEAAITLRLSDGLDAIHPQEAEDILITGLGGTLMVRILSRTPWLQDPNKRLILQPMSHTHEVRSFLCANGFQIERETACQEENRVYICMQASYTQEKRTYPAAYSFAGEISQDSSPAATAYLRLQLQHVTRRATALEQAGERLEEAATLRECERALQELIQCRTQSKTSTIG